MILRIEAFTTSNGTDIPQKYTCDGEQISPGVTWREVPEGTHSFILVMEALDVPNRSNPLILWIVFDIPGTVREITTNTIPEFAKLGSNDFGNAAYNGPCPEPGPNSHRYRIQLYALDTVLDLPAGTPAQHIVTAMKDHVLAKSAIVATYKRHG